MAQRWQQPGSSALPFGADSGADADDYYNFLPSDDDNELSDDEELHGGAPAPVAGHKQDIASLASVPLTTGSGIAAAATAKASTSSAVLASIGVVGAVRAAAGDVTAASSRPTQETLELVASGAVILAGGKQLRVSPKSMAQHASRKSQLESALDAFSISTGSSSSLSNPASLASGEAPFRFRASGADVEMTDANAPATVESVTRSTQQQQIGDHSSRAALEKMGTASEETSEETDPLYDDSLDDADEKWVRRNFRGEGSAETDATLCCPCCFMTVCMDCQRHVKFTNQYRSSAAVNCRIKKDEILTYASGAASASVLPFQKRLNMMATRSSGASDGGEAASQSLLLTANEFYPVACSDCGTTVGVYDRHQQYHFFNVLPSNC